MISGGVSLHRIKHVERASTDNAIETLMVTDELFRLEKYSRAISISVTSEMTSLVPKLHSPATWCDKKLGSGVWERGYEMTEIMIIHLEYVSSIPTQTVVSKYHQTACLMIF